MKFDELKFFMEFSMKRPVRFFIFLFCIEVFSFASQSQTYPNKSIDIVLGFSPGGSTDMAARVIAKALEIKWGASIRVINKPGGNTLMAVDTVMRAEPDGYTMLMDSQSQSSLLGVVVPNLPWNIMDRTFISVVAQTPNIVLVPIDSPFKTLAEASEAIKKNPSLITWTSLGGAGSQDFMFRRWVDALGVNVAKTHAVQVKGGAEAVTMVAGGHVNIGVSAWSGLAAAYKAKRVRLLAIAGPDRISEAPDIPTTSEAGYPKAETMYWLGISGPPKLPIEIVNKWKTTVQEILKDDKVIDQLSKFGLTPYFKNDSEMRKLVLQEKAYADNLWPH